MIVLLFVEEQPLLTDVAIVLEVILEKNLASKIVQVLGGEMN